MVYYLSSKVQPKNNPVIIRQLKELAGTLSSCYDNLKELAGKATVRKPQLILYYLASETHKYYSELIAQIELFDDIIFTPFLKEIYSGEWRIVSFDTQNKTDNTNEIFAQCSQLKLTMQKAYSKILTNRFISLEQKKLLERQLNKLLASFPQTELSE
jgi:hypothetical protein